MPTRTERPCDGCGAVRDDLEPYEELVFCPDCLRRREADPPIIYRGRALPYSEFKRQAKDDPDLEAALAGDTVQDQVRAAKERRR